MTNLSNAAHNQQPGSSATEAEQNPELQKLVNEYSEFAYVVSHDLQSPVRQLKGFTDCLLNSLETLDPQQQAYKDMIDHVAEHAEKTLDALLVFSRLNTDEKYFETLDPNEIIAESLKRLGIRPQNFNGTLEIEEDMPPIYGDKALIIQAFYHLIDNAVKFQPEGQKPGIKIRAERSGTKTTFTIEDNGIGMEPNKIHLAFVILRKLHPEDQNYGGRGVGLSFAKKIAKIHKGDVEIESQPDKGTKVMFSCDLNENDRFLPFKRPV